MEMFDRTTFRQLEALFAPVGTTQQQVANQVAGLRLVLRLFIGLLGPVKALWDNAFAVRLTGQEGGALVNGLTVRQWRQYSAAFLCYAVFMKMPLNALLAMELPDGSHPFAVFDPEALEGMGSMSLEQIAFSEPESVVPVVEEEPVEGGE
jgi:hypothetical protein